jgi:hypothetical protein
MQYYKPSWHFFLQNFMFPFFFGGALKALCFCFYKHKRFKYKECKTEKDMDL